jgi:hypothetical protein
MKTSLFILFLLAANVIAAQTTFKGNTYTYKQNKGELHLDLIFNETTQVFAIVDSVHYLPILKQMSDSVLILDFVWFGRVHENGPCQLEITLREERFLICKENRCDVLVVSPPLFKAEKAKHKWLYKKTTLTWDEGNNELRVE